LPATPKQETFMKVSRIEMSIARATVGNSSLP
jgi:hypothetical protein